MKFRIIVISAMLAALFTLSSCLTTTLNIKVDVTCEEFEKKSKDLGNEYEIEVHDKITVMLCANPTTGYQWDYEITEEGVLKLEDHDYEEPEGDLVGAAGRDVWTFEADKKGTTEVLMKYSRPWGDDEKVEWTYTLDVTVE